MMPKWRLTILSLAFLAGCAEVPSHVGLIDPEAYIQKRIASTEVAEDHVKVYVAGLRFDPTTYLIVDFVVEGPDNFDSTACAMSMQEFIAKAPMQWLEIENPSGKEDAAKTAEAVPWLRRTITSRFFCIAPSWNFGNGRGSGRPRRALCESGNLQSACP